MAIRARLYPREGHLPALVMHCAHTRFVYNLGLEQRSMWRPGKSSIGVYEQKRQLTEARAEFDWLAQGSTVVQQQALFDLDRAYRNFFDRRAAYPRFRKRGVDESFSVRDIKIKKVSHRHGMVLIPKTGWVKFRAHRDWEGYTRATSARVSLRNGRWHIAFTTPPPAKIVAGTGSLVGIDRGVANTIATTDGLFAHMPTLTLGEQDRFLTLQRRLARQTRVAKAAGTDLRTCNRRNRTLGQMASLRRRLDDRRTDWVEQSTTALARDHDFAAVEILNTKGMTRRPAPKPDPATPGTWLPNNARAKAALNRLILASRWHQLERRLADKLPDGHLIRVPAPHTSTTCRVCDHNSSLNRQSQAVFVCTNCGHTAHADTNAAENIAGRAITILTGAPPVRTGTTGVCGRTRPVGNHGQDRQRSAVNGRISLGRAITKPRQPAGAGQ